MTTKEEEYKAEICKIAGFALIAPMGKVVLSMPYIELSEASISHILYIVLIISLAAIGATMIFKGAEILRGKEN